MKTVLVTGAAGFIGSHLCEALLARDLTVRGVDSFSSHYPRELKELNLAELRRSSGFDFHERDIAEMPLDDLVEGVDTVFHLAARPGVRDSWTDFDDYAHSNVVGTKRVLDACAGRPVRLLFASSSSVYGNSDRLPAEEGFPAMPVSPYGATKVMTEVLASAYVRGHGLDAVGLRYFTVYGPRQRPDMAIARFIEAAAAGAPISVYGDGRQLRDMTFVGDAVAATIAAGEKGRTGEIYNVASGRARPLLEILGELERALGRSIEIEHEGEKLGDVRDTWASISKAQEELGFAPGTDLADGLAQQAAEAERRRFASVTGR